MKTAAAPEILNKSPTDISGFDAMTGGGMARRRKDANERVFSRVGRLDTMLGGGFDRGASVPIIGFRGQTG